MRNSTATSSVPFGLSVLASLRRSQQFSSSSPKRGLTTRVVQHRPMRKRCARNPHQRHSGHSGRQDPKVTGGPGLRVDSNDARVVHGGHKVKQSLVEAVSILAFNVSRSSTPTTRSTRTNNGTSVDGECSLLQVDEVVVQVVEMMQLNCPARSGQLGEFR